MGESKTQRLTLYVRSIKIPESHFVDRESAVHACAKAGSTPFEGLKGASHLMGRVFPDEDWHAIQLAQSCQSNEDIEVEIVDVSKSFWQRLKLRRQGIKETPQFRIDDQLLPPITNITELHRYL